MKQLIRNWILAIVFTLSAGGLFGAVATAPIAQAAANCDSSFLTIPAWYNGLTEVDSKGNCHIKGPDAGQDGLSAYIWKIVLNIIDIMLNLVGYLTVGFLIFGGFKYITAAGSADAMAKAKTTITNAVIGLVLSIMSIAIVNLVSGAL